MSKVIKLLKWLYQAILVGVTTYEVGKNSGKEESQIILAHPTSENLSHTDSGYSIFILAGVVTIGVLIFVAKELKKCIQCGNSNYGANYGNQQNQQFEMVRVVPNNNNIADHNNANNNNDNNNNNRGIQVNV